MVPLRNVHITLLNKGQASTKYYRFLTNNGGWVWIQSYLTIVHNTRSSRPHCIVSVNYAISQREYPDVIINAEQVRPSNSFSSANGGAGGSASGGGSGGGGGPCSTPSW